ncbi:hypothetical protein FOA52_010144 [Chlamydomonas sp. UWO 241]|nr:hypothetical protein FOA52_010144 [Chlamydomonas sp. UWO 241]
MAKDKTPKEPAPAKTGEEAPVDGTPPMPDGAPDLASALAAKLVLMSNADTPGGSNDADKALMNNAANATPKDVLLQTMHVLGPTALGQKANPSYAGAVHDGGRGGGRGGARGGRGGRGGRGPNWEAGDPSGFADGRNGGRGRGDHGEHDPKRSGGSLDGFTPAKKNKREPVDKFDRSWEHDSSDKMIVELMKNKRNPEYKYCYKCSWPPTGYFAPHKMADCKHNPNSANCKGPRRY